MVEDDRDFYRCPSPMSAPGRNASLFAPLPDDVHGLAGVVPDLMLHQHLAPLYRQQLTPERHAEAQLRTLEAILARLAEIDGRALTERREPERRVIGVCRHFTLLLVAMLQAKGFAARARCGFATYFEPGKFVDHWVAEYWNAREQCWVMVDAQLDDVLDTAFKFDFDRLQVPRDRFIVAGEA